MASPGLYSKARNAFDRLVGRIVTSDEPPAVVRHTQRAVRDDLRRSYAASTISGQRQNAYTPQRVGKRTSRYQPKHSIGARQAGTQMVHCQGVVEGYQGHLSHTRQAPARSSERTRLERKLWLQAERERLTFELERARRRDAQIREECRRATDTLRGYKSPQLPADYVIYHAS